MGGAGAEPLSLGLSPDTEETMMDTINFARELPVDMMKFGISIAFPGTAMFNNYVKQDLVKSYDWDEYFIYTSQPLFNHAKLSYATIKRYMEIAHRKAIFQNPKFWLRRLWRGIRTGEFFWDAYYALQYFSKPTISGKVGTEYYARERWPVHSYAKAPPVPAQYQTVRKHLERAI